MTDIHFGGPWSLNCKVFPNLSRERIIIRKGLRKEIFLKEKKIRRKQLDNDEDEKGDEDFCLVCLSPHSFITGLPNCICQNCGS